MNRLLFIATICFFTFSSCKYINQERVRGNGNVKKEMRATGHFNGVAVRGALDLVVVTDSSNKVEIEADENLMEYIETRVDGNILEVNVKAGYNLDATKSIKVYASAPIFEKLDASGACSIKSENELNSNSGLVVRLSGASGANLQARSPLVDVGVSGASHATLMGQTKDLRLDASGSSRISAYELLTENADVDVSGASHAEVFASVMLKADASGASGVRYKGTASVQSEASGASSVRKVQ